MTPTSVQCEHPALGELNNKYFLRDSVYKTRLKVKRKNESLWDWGRLNFERVKPSNTPEKHLFF